MIDKLTLRISSNEKIEEFINTIEDSTKVNHFHIDISEADGQSELLCQSSLSINSCITNENFFKMCEKIKRLDLYNRIHLDISSLPDVSDDWIDAISDTLKSFNPREINFNFSNSNLSDIHFEKLVYQSLKNMDNLEKLHLVMENLNITANKMKYIEDIVEILKSKKLNHVFLNLKRNEIYKFTLDRLNEIIGNLIIKEIYI